MARVPLLSLLRSEPNDGTGPEFTSERLLAVWQLFELELAFWNPFS